MGLYIDIEMPIKQVYVILNPNGLVEILDANNVLLEEYQAVPIPAHGKLIDANVLCNKLEKAGKIKPYLEGALNVAISFALTAPTIIPANEDK